MISKIEKLIGNTPMIKIKYKYKGKLEYVYSKLEYYNLTGSIKDRMVLYSLNKAKERNELKDEQAIIEVTSGNTGISLASIGSFYKHPVHIFMPDWVSSERKKIIESYGATVHLVSKDDGGFKKAIELADELALKIKGYRLNQFNNKDNINVHYLKTGEEIFNQLDDIGGFVSGIGTGGTLMGVGKKLKEIDVNFKLFALEPDGLQILSKGISVGNHKIEGIGDDFIPSIVDKNLIDEIIVVNDMDSINMSKKLANDLGLGVGISSGANIIAAILAKEKISSNVVTIFADDNKKYLSTDLFNDIDIKENFISTKVELLDYEYVNKLLD